MNSLNTNDINQEAIHFLESMGFGTRNVSPDGLRVILIYAIIGYLQNHKSLEFTMSVSNILHNQKLIPLTQDMEVITKKLKFLMIQEKSIINIKEILLNTMLDLEKKHEEK